MIPVLGGVALVGGVILLGAICGGCGGSEKKELESPPAAAASPPIANSDQVIKDDCIQEVDDLAEVRAQLSDGLSQEGASSFFGLLETSKTVFFDRELYGYVDLLEGKIYDTEGSHVADLKCVGTQARDHNSSREYGHTHLRFFEISDLAGQRVGIFGIQKTAGYRWETFFVVADMYIGKGEALEPFKLDIMYYSSPTLPQELCMFVNKDLLSRILEEQVFPTNLPQPNLDTVCAAPSFSETYVSPDRYIVIRRDRPRSSFDNKAEGL
ncbi:MAG: hypothetical protein HQ596_01375 [Candidatus Saganbacteria bacterium]|nr:hypothetical protein [Candidatus Saganbacteria bacterium]